MRDVIDAVRSAFAGDALVPPQMLGRLLPRLRPARPRSRSVTHLTARELEVLRLLSHGMTNRQVADRIGISLNTARNHIQATITKLGAHSKLEAVATAVREGILRYDDAYARSD